MDGEFGHGGRLPVGCGGPDKTVAVADFVRTGLRETDAAPYSK
jgi:hypothetical protein